MNKYSFRDCNGRTWERVNKSRARNAYNNGLTVLFCPVNLNPFSEYYTSVMINISDDIDIGISSRFTKENSFERVLNAFDYYNCTDNETGHYTAFYLPVVTVDKFTGKAPTGTTRETVRAYDYTVLEGVKNV